ncbi:hypothetical protein B296_00036620 [Ensete ventricosum]|uniref:Secreted protein n=1 Tax=Ensete ventricosum TaxID=4639 RepID=A0A426Y4Y7_ENSVE|nr:hypothetical protein B296_00036620 [Ensete ventricosum]
MLTLLYFVVFCFWHLVTATPQPTYTSLLPRILLLASDHRHPATHRSLQPCVAPILDTSLFAVSSLDFILSIWNLTSVLVHALLDAVYCCIDSVFDVDQSFPILVPLCVQFSFFNHVLDLLLRQPTRRLNSDLLLLSGRLVFGRDYYCSIGIRNLNLRHASGCWWDSHKFKLA